MTLFTRVLFPLCLGLLACGGEKDGTEPATSDDGGTETPVPEGVSVDVVASEGGTVDVGEGSLEIPPNALASDTTITAEATEPSSSLPASDTIVGLVYDFGPDGTTFDPAATLTLPLPVTPASGEVAVMSWLDTTSNTWVDLPSTVSGDFVSAPVAHFTSFVIRITIGGATEVGDCTFGGACGGDVLGTWNLDGICLFVEVGDTSTELPDCLSVEIDADITGTFTFEANNTYSSDTHFTGQATVRFAPDCLTGVTSCAQLEDESFTSCTGDPAVECACTSPIDEMETDSGAWSTSGNRLLLDVDETGGETDSGPSQSDYCVDGSTLEIHDLDEGTVVYASR